MKPVLTKIFKKGEYYQTYLMKLEVSLMKIKNNGFMKLL